METVSPPPLEQRLTKVATIWCDRNEVTLARLGRTVVNDGGFFARIGSSGASTTTATLVKFARFLVDPANWPGGVVAEEARALAHVVGVSLPDARASAGLSGDVPGRDRPSAEHLRAVAR